MADRKLKPFILMLSFTSKRCKGFLTNPTNLDKKDQYILEYFIPLSYLGHSYASILFHQNYTKVFIITATVSSNGINEYFGRMTDTA